MAGLNHKQATKDVADGFIDPAEFLFKNTEYHDCFLIITDTITKKVEKIGAVSTDLISRSSVLSKILRDVKNGELKHVEMNDVTMPIVKLMLTYMYGGKLPEMDRATRAQLALAARSYDLQYLEAKCCKKLVPATVDEVFPALVCVAHLNSAILLPEVTKIIQEKTDEVIKHSDFSKLDSKCLVYIALQEKLAVDEVDLWKTLVLWGDTNKGEEAERTSRDLLGPVLQYVRLTTFTLEQILDEVIPSKILTDSEIVQLLSAVRKKTAFNCPGLCGMTEVRNKGLEKNEFELENNESCKALSICLKLVPRNCGYIYAGMKSRSYFKIEPKKLIELDSLTVVSIEPPLQECADLSFLLKYQICVEEIDEGMATRILDLEKSVQAPYRQFVILKECFCDKSATNSGLKLSNSYTYNIRVFFIIPHPSFSFENENTGKKCETLAADDFDVEFYGPCHVIFLTYKV